MPLCSAPLPLETLGRPGRSRKGSRGCSGPLPAALSPRAVGPGERGSGACGPRCDSKNVIVTRARGPHAPRCRPGPAVSGLECTWGCWSWKLVGGRSGAPFQGADDAEPLVQSRVSGVVRAPGCGVACGMSLSDGRASPVFPRREECFVPEVYGVSADPRHAWVASRRQDTLSGKGLLSLHWEKPFFPSWRCEPR